MEEKAEKDFRDILGINHAPTGVQTASSVIGGLLFGIGFLGALKASDKQETYIQATRDTQSRIREIGPAFDIKAEEIRSKLTTDLSAYQTRTEAGIKQGLINRGIIDKGIGEQAAGQVREGLGGAYASAQAALAGAKLTAGRAVTGALSNYYQGMAQKQYESQMAKYYSKMGLWGALGGFGASALGADNKKPEAKKPDKQIFSQNPKLNLYNRLEDL